MTKKNIILVVGIAVVLLLLFLLKDWWKGAIITGLGGYTNKETTIRVDTLPIQYDTVYPPAKIVKIPVKEPILIEDTRRLDSIMKVLLVLNDKVEGNVVDSLRYYSYSIEDSILKGSINTITNTKGGEVVKQDFKYTPKIPIYITKTIPIKETVTEVLSADKRDIVGVGVIGSQLGTIGIGGIYQTNNWQFQLNYSIFTNDNKIQINNNSYESVIQVGVFKLF